MLTSSCADTKRAADAFTLDHRARRWDAFWERLTLQRKAWNPMPGITERGLRQTKKMSPAATEGADIGSSWCILAGNAPSMV